jgi:hypothetical protein
MRLPHRTLAQVFFQPRRQHMLAACSFGNSTLIDSRISRHARA